MTVPRTLLLSLATAFRLPALTTSAAAPDGGDPALEAKRRDLDQRYAFGPTPARELGYRIAWQASMGEPLKRVDVIGPDVYTLNDRNRLTRVDRTNGKVVWTIDAADPNDTVWGVNQGVPTGGQDWGRNDGDRVYVTSDPVVFVIDHTTGSIVGRQNLERVPSTGTLRYQNYLVFGTRSGQIVWHQYVVGHAWRANQLRGPILGTPLMVGSNRIAAGSLGGTLLMLDAKSTGRIWGDQVFDGVTAELAAGDGKLYCAGLDQYLRAFDAANGDVAWRYFTQSKLDTPPTYFEVTGSTGTEGRVLQWVESEGLVCLHAETGDAIEGKVAWTLPDARGDFVGTVRDQACLWDAEARMLRLVDVARGAVTTTIDLPQIDQIVMNGDSIFAIGTDGRIVRLDPVG